MSDQIISLTSSEEEDNAEPPPKKIKGGTSSRRDTPTLPEVTLTLVPSPKPKPKNSENIETVSLDSDDDVSEVNTSTLEQDTSENLASSDKNPKENSSVTNKRVDLINLIDDEEDTQSKAVEVNETVDNLGQANAETVSIDDSDTEIDTNQDVNIPVENRNTSKAVVPEKEKDESKDSIIIDDSDEETEKENHCEKGPSNTFPVCIQKTSAQEVAEATVSKDELDEAKTLFKQFIKLVEEKIVDSTFEEILPKKAPIIKKYFNRSGSYVNEKAFKTLLIDSIEGIRKSKTVNGANIAVLAFHKVFENLKSHVAETTIIIEEDNLPKIKKLEHTIKLLRSRIKQLEVAEVNFDDDGDSAYIMLDRYQSRLNKIYAKYCQYIKRNPYSGRATYDRITFVNSKYNEINQAITKKYKNSLVFPSYYELENYITKISKKEKLNLSEAEIKHESKKCFKVLGGILQKKRRQELYDSHLDFVESTEDPATKDISLENVLKKNYAEGKEKIEKLYQKYVNKQERGEDHVSSEEEQSTDESDAEESKRIKGKEHKNGKLKIKKKGKVKEKEINEKINENDQKEDINENLIIEDVEKEKVENQENDIQEKVIEICQKEQQNDPVDTKVTEENVKIQENNENMDKIENQEGCLSNLNTQKVDDVPKSNSIQVENQDEKTQ